MKLYDRYGRAHESQDILAADRLLKMKRDLSGTEANGVWEVIGECIKIWSSRHPEAYKSYLVDLEGIKQTRHDPKFALSKGKSLRYTLDFPEPLMYMIRMLYSEEELPMNKEFFHWFAKRFPMFQVAQKI